MTDDPYAERGFIPAFHIPPAERVPAVPEVVNVVRPDADDHIARLVDLLREPVEPPYTASDVRASFRWLTGDGDE